MNDFLNIPDDVCCCCGHKLKNHIDEGDGWRCHNLGQDWYQCECFLRKSQTDNEIKGFDLKLRLQQYIEENPSLGEFLKEIKGTQK